MEELNKWQMPNKKQVANVEVHSEAHVEATTTIWYN
jgi:hypothetical protein